LSSGASCQTGFVQGMPLSRLGAGKIPGF